MTEKMKPSGIAWIGDIPSEWESTKIKYCVQTIGSGTTPDSGNPAYYDDDGIFPWIQSGDLYGRSVIRDTEKRITKSAIVDFPALSWYEKDFVVIAMYGASVGNVAISKIDSYTNQACCVIKTRKDGDLRYLYYYLSAAQEDMLQKAFGGTQPNISQVIIKNLSFLNVPTKEQTQIADFLDVQCAKIDSVIADIEKQIETLQKYKKSLITETATKGLDQSVPMKDSGIDWIGKIPSHWRVIRITKYLDSLVDYRGKTPEKVDDGVFLVTARNIKNGIVDYSLSQEYVAAEEYEQIMHRGKPEMGDVLFTTEAPLGEVANVDRTDIALAQRVIKFRGRKGCVDNYYLKYWLMSVGFQSFLWSLATGSTALGIAASKLGQLKMVLPPIDEQKAIAERLDCDCTNIDAIIVEKRKQLETAQQYKKSLIYEYVTGKKRVTEVN